MSRDPVAQVAQEQDKHTINKDAESLEDRSHALWRMLQKVGAQRRLVVGAVPRLQEVRRQEKDVDAKISAARRRPFGATLV